MIDEDPFEDQCIICDQEIRVQINRGTLYCSENCRKRRLEDIEKPTS